MAKSKPGEPQINNPNAGKIQIIVSGPAEVKSTDPRVVVKRS